VNRYARLNLCFIITVLSHSLVYAASPTIENGKKVTIEYILKVDGRVYESTSKLGPLVYVHGEGVILRGLSRGLEGLSVGAKKSITISPQAGFGPKKKNNIIAFPIEKFSNLIDITVGTKLKLRKREGGFAEGYIIEVKEDEYFVDFGHPLAGKTLQFDVEVVSIK